MESNNVELIPTRIKASFPEEDFKKEFKVTTQTPQGVFKGGGFVLFKKGMAYPSKTIAHKGKRNPKLSFFLCHHKKAQQHKHQESSNKMEGSAGFIFVFA